MAARPLHYSQPMPRRENASPRAKTASADQLQQTSLRSFFPPIEGAAEKGGTKAGGAAKKEAKCQRFLDDSIDLTGDISQEEQSDLEGGAAKKRGKKEVGETSLTQCVPSKKRGAAAAKVEAKQKPPAKKAKGDGNANAKKKEKKEQDEFGKSLAPKILFHAGNGTPGEML